MIKKFIIHQLSGKNTTFEFDVTKNLKSFRKCIFKEPVVSYSLITNGVVVIYGNDIEDESVQKIIEMSSVIGLLDKDTIDLYLTFNFGYPRIRTGKFLLPHNTIELIEERSDTPNILLCPINMNLIQYAIKVNGRFYDIEAISEYLAGEFNKLKIDGTHVILCPLRTVISLDFIASILSTLMKHKSVNNIQNLDIIHTNSVRNYFVYEVFAHMRNTDQDEYNKLLLDHCNLSTL